MIVSALKLDAALSVAYAARERDRQEFAAVTGLYQPDELAAWMAERYAAIPGLLSARAGEEDAPSCVGGAVHVRPGTCALLFYATDDFPSIALSMTKFIRRRYFPAMRAAGYHRIEAVTSAQYPEMHKWLEMLGMRREGYLRAYGSQGEDFIQYASVHVRPTSH